MKRLLEIQKWINENGPEEFKNLELIRMEELRAIRRIWVLEKHEFIDLVPRIYESVIGKKFEDPDWIHYDNFSEDEWDILKEVCSTMFRGEELAFEMMYSLVDIENRADGLGDRKGILDDVKKTITKTFYQSESDATKYYSDRMIRKKEMGGQYNEKFLNYSQVKEPNYGYSSEDECK